MKNVPCKGCEKRFVGCHSSCLAYKDYEAWAEYQRQERHKRQTTVDGLYQVQRKSSVIKRKSHSDFD